MKTVQCLMLACLLGIALTACNAPTPEPKPEVETPAPAEETPAVVEEPAAVVEETPAPAASATKEEAEWISLFNGENLEGWTQRGAATWSVKDGVMIGVSEGGQGHIYGTPELTDLEVKGMFRIDNLGKNANSGLYFRANPPEDNPDGYPKGYEAQICNSQDAFTGWLWKPGTPTGEATELLTKDGEWFSMRVKAVGTQINIWVNDQLVMTYEDEEYKKGFFAIQCHNELMTVEAKELFYRAL
jgi:hypothetical protein